MIDGLPDLTVPIVLSFLGIKDLCRCSCIAREWASCVEIRRIRIKKNAAISRAQVHHILFSLLIMYGFITLMVCWCLPEHTQPLKSLIDYLDIVVSANAIGNSTRDVFLIVTSKNNLLDLIHSGWRVNINEIDIAPVSYHFLCRGSTNIISAP